MIDIIVLCIGANWMHDLPSRGPDEDYSFGTAQQRLWSWLILCDDCMEPDIL